MRVLRICLLVFAAGHLFGCAAALVPSTSDPRVKISQAEQMWRVGRWIPAERLALDAVELAKSANDKHAEANAHRYLGNFYKGKLYVQHSEWFAEQGRFDETYGRSLDHFQRAALLWKEVGDGWGVAAEKFNMGNAYGLRGDQELACKAYADAMSIYKDPETVFTGSIHPWNPAYDDFPSMVTAFMKDESCPGFD